MGWSLGSVDFRKEDGPFLDKKCLCLGKLKELSSLCCVFLGESLNFSGPVSLLSK